MVTELALNEPEAKCPVHYSRDTDDIVRRCRSGAEMRGRVLMMMNMPSKYERSCLSTRLSQIAEATRGCAAKEIVADVRSLLNCYPTHQKLAEHDSKLIIAKYVTELKQFPAWAVGMVCRKVKQGNAGGIGVRFEPTVVELILLCKQQVNALNTETDEIIMVLTGEQAHVPLAPEARARLKAMTDAWLDRSDPLAANLHKIGEEYEEAKRNASKNYTLETGRRMFEREHAHAGTDPTSLASPKLAQKLKADAGETARLAAEFDKESRRR